MSFLRERTREICLYMGLVGIFIVMLFLYNVPLDAVQYIVLLMILWGVFCGAIGFFRYRKRHEALLKVERSHGKCLDDLPQPEGMLEDDYQRIVRLSDNLIRDMESTARISKREMEDYYGMWIHQIKTPIAAMHVLLQSYENGDVVDQILTKNIKMELFKIEQYVEMVLTYLRVEDMSSDLSLKTYNLDDIVKHAVRKYSQPFILKKIKLNYTTIDIQVLTDKKWLLFVIEQILSNALKYTKSMGSIAIYMEETKQGKCLVIEDTGIGIQPEDLPRVFEKGFTGYNGRTDKKSTGIGLYLCKVVMDRLRHSIWIESEVDQGTKVFLCLSRDEGYFE